MTNEEWLANNPDIAQQVGVKVQPLRIDCIHIGVVLRTEGCTSCKGNTQLKVYECKVHKECTLVNNLGAKVCKDCSDYIT